MGERAPMTWLGLVAVCCACASAGPLPREPYLLPLQQADRCRPTFIVSATEPTADERMLLVEVVRVPADVARIARAGNLIAGESHRRRLLRLLSLKNEVSSALSEVACLDDALEGLQGEVESQARSRETRITLASLGVGLAAGVAAGVADLTASESSAGPIIAISGGLAAGGLGAVALVYPAPTVVLEHRENVLQDVWSGGTGASLAPFVWRLLDAPREDGVSPRGALLAHWREVLEGAEPSPEGRQALEALLFGPGGIYDAESLRIREVLFEYLEVQVALMNQELSLLVRYLEAHDQLDEPGGRPGRSTEPDVPPPEPTAPAEPSGAE